MPSGFPQSTPRRMPRERASHLGALHERLSSLPAGNGFASTRIASVHWQVVSVCPSKLHVARVVPAN